MLYILHHSCLYATGSTLILQQHTGMDYSYNKTNEMH